ncbi:NF-kappa-B inhibitor zeta-like isoform X2 [Narcine bancroftii]
MAHGRLHSAEQRKWLKKMNACPPKNVEDLLEDLVEVLETDLKQRELCPIQRSIEGDRLQGCSKVCPVSLRDFNPRTHYPVLQTDDAAFQCHLGYLYKSDAAHRNLMSPSHKSYSSSECHSPDCLVAVAAECCGNMTEKDILFSHQHWRFQTTKQLSHSPLLDVKEFGQDALSNTQIIESSWGEVNYPLEASQKQYIPRSSGLTFFQFQLQQIESSLITLTPKDLLSVDKYGNTLLHYAAIHGKRALAYGLACRMSCMSRIDTKNSKGQTALHLAAGQNQHLMVNDLISLGAWINERDFEGKTPVHICAENGFLHVLQVIEKILKNGTEVDMDARDKNYLTPLHYVVLAHIATVQEFDNYEMGSEMQRFLALRKEQLLDGIRCLLRMGSSLYMQDRNGRNAIHFAEEENDTEVLNFLYDHVNQMKAIGYKEFKQD